MIAFASLILGLVVGVVPIQFVVQEPVSRVEVTLDGAPVGKLTHKPWSIQLDLGKELAPHEVVARAFAADGRLVGEVRQSLNLPRPLAEARIVLGADNGKEPPSAQVLSGSVEGAPTAIRATFDGKSVTADPSGRIALPTYDRSTSHILAAKVEFSGGLSAEVVTVVGGGAAAESGNALTLIPLRRKGKGRLPPLDRLQGWFARKGQPVKVLAVDHERPPAEVILVRDLDATQARSLLGMQRNRPTGVLPGGFPADAPRSEATLETGDRVRIAWPVPRRTEGSTGPSELFEQSGEFTGEDASFRSLLTRGRLTNGATLEYRTAEAVAVAGMRALSERSRRAVVLVVNSQPDASAFDPNTVRRYLDRIHVPLFVWSLDPSASSKEWGVAEDISTQSRLEKAVKRLRGELDRQEVVWVAGSTLPQEIRLTSSADGFEILGGEVATAEIPPQMQADAKANAEAEAKTEANARAAEAAQPPKAESRTTRQSSLVQESAEVHVMNLDVFAADSKGRFVPGLASSDFLVYVDGRPHKVDYFSVVDPPVRTDAGTPSESASASPSSPRRLLIYLELAHISPADRERMVSALRGFIDRMVPGDSARIVVWDGRSREITGWSGDKPALLAGLVQAKAIRSGDRLLAEQRAMRSVDGADGGLMGDLPEEGVDAIGRNRAAAHLDEERAQVIAMLRDLDNQIATLSVIDGKRSILFVSGGLEVREGSRLSIYASPVGGSQPGLDTRMAVADLAPILRHANSSRVTFFPFDVRGVSENARFENQESLRRLAEETGGLAILNSNDMGVGLARVDDASSRYYSIGVTLSADAARGYRDVRVETTRPGLSVRSRKGFASLTPTEEAADVVRAALLTRVEEKGIRVSVQPGAAASAGKLWTVPVKVSVPAEDLVFLPKQGGSSGSAEVFLAAMDESGRMSDVTRREVTVRPEDCPAARCSFSFPLETRKGKTRLAVTVRDVSGKRGTAIVELSVP